jgi:ubiquinone/menaquinone biosynthesis C-methylase UbiE
VIPVALIQHPAAPRRVVGVDITSAMLRGASAAVASQDPDRRISLVCGSGMQMPFAASAFDTAICALGVHHMRADVLLEEMRRVLRPGGQLVIIDVALANLFQTLPGRLLLRGLAQFYGRREGTARFEAEMEAVGNMLTPSQWRDLLVAAGFQDILLTIVPATRPWYPPGILASALSPEKQE